jgi:hypothetical protein
MPVAAVYTIIVFLVGLVPLLILDSGPFFQALVLVVTAIAIMLVAVNVRAGDLARLAALLGLSAAVAALPGVWMALQLLPLPGLAHPIWTSAAAALNRPMAGTVSIDTGATLLAFTRYCGFLAIGVITTAVALNRVQALRIFSVLMGITALVSGELILFELGYPEFPVQLPAAQAISIMGLILSCGAAISAYEGDDDRLRNSDSKGKIARTVAASVVVAAACFTAVVLNADAVVLFSAAFGTGTVMAVWAIRQFGLRLWGISGIAAVAILGTAILLVSAPSIKDTDATLALSNRSPDSIAATARMLSDVRWTGVGAGCFNALLPIYRDVDDAAANAPTATALIAIELGRPALWALIILALGAALYFFRAALLRGRDYVYSAVGAGCIMAIVVLSFSDSGTIELSTSLLASIILGLALAQSKSLSS